MDKADALVIGAGPAGVSCAVGLAAHGLNVVVIDRSVFPRPKVCGGFIGPQSRDLLTSWGVWQELCRRGVHVIERSGIYAASGESAVIPMDENPALGCSRRLLDAILLARLKAMGVRVIEGAAVTRTHGNGRGFEVDVDDHRSGRPMRFDVRHLIDTAGHGSRKWGAVPRQLGIAAMYEQMPFLQGQVSLFCCRHGHVGINPFEGGRVNVCCVVEQSHFESRGSNPEAVMHGWLSEHKALGKALWGVKRLSPWKAVCVPVRSRVTLFEDGIWRAGDAAAHLDPVTGGGMSVALHSGRMLAKAIVSRGNDKDRLKQYSRNYSRWFNGQRWLAGAWGKLSHHPPSSEAVVRLLNSSQSLRSRIMGYSHPMHLNIKP